MIKSPTFSCSRGFSITFTGIIEHCGILWRNLITLSAFSYSTGKVFFICWLLSLLLMIYAKLRLDRGLEFFEQHKTRCLLHLNRSASDVLDTHGRKTSKIALHMKTNSLMKQGEYYVQLLNVIFFLHLSRCTNNIPQPLILHFIHGKRSLSVFF